MKSYPCKLPYGHGDLVLEIPTDQLLGVVTAAEIPMVGDEATILENALNRPIGTRCLDELAEAGQSVCIVTSDMTRPCPSDRMLPPVLSRLHGAGVADEEVVIVLALGLHRPMTEAEIEEAVGAEVFARYRVLNHDPEETVRLGSTRAGTPVDVFRPVIDADVRICLGNLEFHYFAGFSGGAKAIIPGCASRETLNANHAMMTRPEAVAGRIEDNPVRQDLEEATAMVGVDFILNVVVDDGHRICEAVAGDLILAHRRGCELVTERGSVRIRERGDIVLVSSGGHPSDVNLYQAQKALDNAAHAVKPGGVIVWVAECCESFGNSTFETWLRQARSPEDVLERIQADFVLGGHKAAAVASVMKQAAIYLVSSLDEEVVAACGLHPFSHLDEALASARRALGQDASILALPNGGSVMPIESVPD